MHACVYAHVHVYVHAYVHLYMPPWFPHGSLWFIHISVQGSTFKVPL